MQFDTTMIQDSRHSRSAMRKRSAMTLLEMVVSMGLLSVIMLPVIGLLATSYKVYNASSDRGDGNYARQTALDGISLSMRGAQRVVSSSSDHVEVLFSSGASGRLSFAGGQLNWTFAGSTNLLSSGLTSARFSVGAAAGAGPTAGELVLVELASRVNAPSETWSSMQVWVRPTL